MLHPKTRPFVLQYSLNSLLTLPDIWEYTSLLVPLSLSTTLWPTPTSPLIIPSLQYSVRSCCVNVYMFYFCVTPNSPL